MPDDPREILRAAGVECAEVDNFYRDFLFFKKGDVPWSAMDAILALARLVAKYKWQRDEAINDGPGYYPRDALDRRWEEHCK